MTHLIDKDALVAEIERRTDELYDLLPDAGKVEKGMITISEACNTGKYTELESFQDYIDTLETKEVDLEKEILDWIGDEDSCKNGKWTWYECNKMLRHFFELGLKAQKGE